MTQADETYLFPPTVFEVIEGSEDDLLIRGGKLLMDTPAIRKAIHIAVQAHSGQVDKGGNDYINHPFAVAGMVDSEDGQIAALLHDVIEDTTITLQDLRRQDIPEQVIKAVDCLTKRNGETLENYLNHIKSDPLATAVKLADLTHNSDLRRISAPTEKDFARVQRYRWEIAELQKETGPLE